MKRTFLLFNPERLWWHLELHFAIARVISNTFVAVTFLETLSGSSNKRCATFPNEIFVSATLYRQIRTFSLYLWNFDRVYT